MKRHLVIALTAGIAVLYYGAGLAQDEEAEKPVEVVADGTNYCLLCELSKDDVDTANDAYASLNALRVNTAFDTGNKELTELSGKTLHYLPTKEAEPLLTGDQYRGSFVTVTGLCYPKAAVIKVISFEGEKSGAAALGTNPAPGTITNKQDLGVDGD